MSRCRAKIIKVKNHHTYDIRYDTGDELRYVAQDKIRMRPDKGNFSYRVELGIVVVYVFMPLDLLLGTAVGPNALLLGPFLVCLVLLVLQIGNYAYR